jgi:hypothetical protein
MTASLVSKLRKGLSAFVLLTVCALCAPVSASAQTGASSSSVLPTGGGQALLDPSDSVILLLDHQAGLFQTVKDISVAELRTNTAMLAKLATLLKIPVITTTSEPNGPNGPLMPEIHQFAPHAVYVGRKGEVNAWDNEDFVKTVRATGRKTLIMAGVWTMFSRNQAKSFDRKPISARSANPAITPTTSGTNGHDRDRMKPKPQTFQRYAVR